MEKRYTQRDGIVYEDGIPCCIMPPVGDALELQAKAQRHCDALNERAALEAERDQLQKSVIDAITVGGQQCAALEERVKTLEGKNQLLADYLTQSGTDIGALREQIDALRAALLKHGRHSNDCDVFDFTQHAACTCGFSAALGGSEGSGAACSECGGSGKISTSGRGELFEGGIVTCAACVGTGKAQEQTPQGEPCPECGGLHCGQTYCVNRDNPANCKGTGHAPAKEGLR
jgi:hypothetical protein